MSDPLYILRIPFPPSVNAYYENKLGEVRRGPKAGKIYTGRRISGAGLAFRDEVAAAARRGHRSPPRLDGRLRILVLARPPSEKADGSANRNIRDLNNLWKSLADALTYARIIADDSLFDHDEILRGSPTPRGEAWVAIFRFDPSRVAAAELVFGIAQEGLDLR